MFSKTLHHFLILSLIYFVTSEELICGDYELEPPQNFQSETNWIIHQALQLKWSPPTYYETCEVEYKLHIQNLNTSEYLTPVINTFDNNYNHDYGKEDQICIHVRARLYAHFGDFVSEPVYTVNFLDPLLELGPPETLTIENTPSQINLNWTTPLGYEKCRAYFMYFIKIIIIDNGYNVLTTNYAGYSYTYHYLELEPYLCKDAVVEVVGYYRGMPGQAISKTFTFGPEGYCEPEKSTN